MAYIFHLGNDGQLMIWNILSGERIQDIDCAFNGHVSCLVWADTRELFAFGCADGSVHLYNWSEAKVNAHSFTYIPYI